MDFAGFDWWQKGHWPVSFVSARPAVVCTKRLASFFSSLSFRCLDAALKTFCVVCYRRDRAASLSLPGSSSIDDAPRASADAERRSNRCHVKRAPIHFSSSTQPFYGSGRSSMSFDFLACCCWLLVRSARRTVAEECAESERRPRRPPNGVGRRHSISNITNQRDVTGR